MAYKLGFIAGAAAGYVIGARAGHGQYEQLKNQTTKVLASEPVQARVAEAAQAVKAKTPAAAHGIVDKAVDAVAAPTTTAGTTTSAATRAERPVGQHRAAGDTSTGPAHS